MLEPKKFFVDEFEFEFAPLKLKAARKLYADVLHYYGGVLSEFGFKFELPKGVNLDSDTEEFIAPSLKSLSASFKEFCLSVDSDWITNTMENVLLPQIRIFKDGNEVDHDTLKGWYEIEFATKCLSDLQVFVECLMIQYSDFLALKGKLKILIELMKSGLKK